ncbi:MAG: hypothetical protein V1495_04505 [Pseudomonadota bacterium]
MTFPCSDEAPVTTRILNDSLARLENKLEQKIEQRYEDAKRYMGVLHEELRSQIGLVLEQLTPPVGGYENFEQRLTSVETDVAVLKLSVRGSFHK